MPPDPYDEIHRDEHDLPEEIEQEEVHGQKNAADPGQYPEEVEMEETHPFPDLLPGYPYGDQSEKEGE